MLQNPDDDVDDKKVCGADNDDDADETKRGTPERAHVLDVIRIGSSA